MFATKSAARFLLQNDKPKRTRSKHVVDGVVDRRQFELVGSVQEDDHRADNAHRAAVYC